MCHIEDENSWTINVKVSFVLSHLPIWHLTGMPKWSFEFLSETASQQVAFICLSFFTISLLRFCLSPDRERTVFSGSGYQPKATWGPLLCSVPVCVSPQSRSLGRTKGSWGHMKNRAAAEGMRETLPKDLCFHCGAEQWSFKLIGDLQQTETWTLGYKFIPHRHISSAAWNESNKWALLSQGKLVWKLKTRDITWSSKWPQQIYSFIISLNCVSECFASY